MTIALGAVVALATIAGSGIVGLVGRLGSRLERLYLSPVLE